MSPTCFCAGQCRQIGYCPTAGGPPMAAPVPLTEQQVRSIVRQEVNSGGAEQRMRDHLRLIRDYAQGCLGENGRHEALETVIALARDGLKEL